MLSVPVRRVHRSSIWRAIGVWRRRLRSFCGVAGMMDVVVCQDLEDALGSCIRARSHRHGVEESTALTQAWRWSIIDSSEG